MFRLLPLTLALAFAVAGGEKKVPPTGRGETETVEVNATVYTGKDAIKELVGSDLDGHFTVVSVQVRSRFGREIDVQRDDFVLRTDKDGEKSAPFAASQIAGRGALVVSETGGGGGGMMGDSAGPVWGGGPGTMDRPRRMGGDGGALGGGPSATEAQAKVQSGAGRQVPRLQKALEAKILPEGKTDKTLSGLLYFPLEKQKAKDLELMYKAADGKISIRFK